MSAKYGIDIEVNHFCRREEESDLKTLSLSKKAASVVEITTLPPLLFKKAIK